MTDTFAVLRTQHSGKPAVACAALCGRSLLCSFCTSSRIMLGMTPRSGRSAGPVRRSSCAFRESATVHPSRRDVMPLLVDDLASRLKASSGARCSTEAPPGPAEPIVISARPGFPRP